MNPRQLSKYHGIVRLDDWSLNANDKNGTNDVSSRLNTWQLQAQSDGRIAVAPGGVTLLCGSTVNLKTSTTTMGGNGYDPNGARTVFAPGMTDGSACLRVVGDDYAGLDLSGFSIDSFVGSPNPNPSGGNVKACIGLQLGKGCSIITGVTKANPCVITTKYYHLLEVGDKFVTENMVGATELEGDTGYVLTVPTKNTFTFSTTLGGAAVDSSAFVAVGTKGLVRPFDLGVADKISRGSVRDITITSCAVAASIEGWLGKVSLKCLNSTVGFMGHYLNGMPLDLVVENNWQGFQLLGCTGTAIGRLKEEGGTGNDLGAPSTIDYSEHVTCANYGGEGSRQATANNAWMDWGLVSACRDIHFPHGFVYAGGAGGVSIALGNISGFTVPERTINGYSTTGSTKGYKGTTAFSAATTVVVTIPTQVDTSYQVLFNVVNADPVNRFWVSTKTTTTFTLNCSAATSLSVDWQVVRN